MHVWRQKCRSKLANTFLVTQTDETESCRKVPARTQVQVDQHGNRTSPDQSDFNLAG